MYLFSFTCFINESSGHIAKKIYVEAENLMVAKTKLKEDMAKNNVNYVLCGSKIEKEI